MNPIYLNFLSLNIHSTSTTIGLIFNQIVFIKLGSSRLKDEKKQKGCVYQSQITIT